MRERLPGHCFGSGVLGTLVRGHRAILANRTDSAGTGTRQRRAPASAPHAIVLNFAVGFLDAAFETSPQAAPLLDRLGAFMPADGLVPVAGGREGEARPLDFAPLPDRPVRGLFSADLIAADLRRLAAEQREDGGWTVDFDNCSPAAVLEWRGTPQ